MFVIDVLVELELVLNLGTVLGEGYQSANGEWCFNHHVPQVYT
jgi:hypothetical protein